MTTLELESLTYFKSELEKRLEELLPQSEEAARYAIFSGGKRLRPLLLYTTAVSFGASLERILDPACSLELIHTYSLIHDDLPCMDDDGERRGRPTLHKVYSEGQALLTGDYLLTYAFQILAETSGLSAEKKIQLIKCLSSESGGEGMIGGQAIDLAVEGGKISFPLLQKMYEQKTGALFSTALFFGGALGTACENDLKILTSLGRSLGIAFQINDDLHDAENPTSSDKVKNKPTSITLLGIEKAKEYKEELFIESIKLISALSVEAPLLEAMTVQLC